MKLFVVSILKWTLSYLGENPALMQTSRSSKWNSINIFLMLTVSISIGFKRWHIVNISNMFQSLAKWKNFFHFLCDSRIKTRWKVSIVSYIVHLKMQTNVNHRVQISLVIVQNSDDFMCSKIIIDKKLLIQMKKIKTETSHMESI